MKSLFLIIFLLTPSLSIARLLHDCDNNGAVLIQLNEIREAIETRQPTHYVYVPVPVEQSRSLPQPNKELTLEQMKIKLYIYGGRK